MIPQAYAEKYQLQVTIEGAEVTQQHPPGHYLIIGDSSTRSNRFMIISVDRAPLTKMQIICLFGHHVVLVEEFDMCDEPPGRFIAQIFEKRSVKRE